MLGKDGAYADQSEGKSRFGDGSQQWPRRPFCKSAGRQRGTHGTRGPTRGAAKELRAEIEAAGGAAHVVQLDVTHRDSIRDAIEHTERAVGPIDILVNNSGVSTTQRLTEATVTDFDHVFGTNVKGAFFVAQEVAQRMIARAKGGPEFHAASSTLPRSPDCACYRRSALLHEQGGSDPDDQGSGAGVGRYGINVNAICPGYIRTEINDEYWTQTADASSCRCFRGVALAAPRISTAPCCCWSRKNRGSSMAPSSPPMTVSRCPRADG